MPSKGAVQGGKPTLQFQDIEETIRARRVVIPPGGVVEPYRVSTGYVVFPLTKGLCRRTTLVNGAVQKVEEVQLDPDKPFYVDGFGSGVTVSIENIGTDPIVCGKSPVKKPPKGGWRPFPPPPPPSNRLKARAKRSR
jgi:hypothetical protein